MKKNLFYLFALVCAMSLLTACSDDDKVVCPISQKVDFTAESGLNLTYNGVEMPGKKVSFVPDAKDAAKATLVLSGNLDLSGLLTRAVAPDMTGAGVFPGSAVTSIPVTLDIQGPECSFAGEGETEYCTFSYSGKASASSMQLALTNVALKNNALAGTTWVPTPLNDDYTEEPVHLVWESEKGVEIIPGWELPMQSVLLIALRMGLIDAGDGNMVSAEDMLCNVLRDVTLGADGNISASYIDAANGGTSVVKTPAHVAQYVLLNDNQLKVYLNLEVILANVQRLAASAKAVDMGSVLSQAMFSLLPMVTDGVPLNYAKEDGKMTVYLNTELLLPLLKGIVAPLFMDEEFVAQLVEAMKADPNFGSMAGMAEGMLKSLPEIINTTSKVEVGLNLTAVR